MNKKNLKRIIIIILGLIFIACLGFYFLPRIYLHELRKSEREMRAYAYLIAGRGCSDMENASDEELKTYIKEDVLDVLSKRKYEKILLEKRKKYEEGEYKDSNCRTMINRVLEILESM